MIGVRQRPGRGGGPDRALLRQPGGQRLPAVAARQPRRGHQDQRLADPRRIGGGERRAEQDAVRRDRDVRWRSTRPSRDQAREVVPAGHDAGRQHERDGQARLARDHRDEQLEPAGDRLQRRLRDLAPARRPAIRWWSGTRRVTAAVPTATPPGVEAVADRQPAGRRARRRDRARARSSRLPRSPARPDVCSTRTMRRSGASSV